MTIAFTNDGRMVAIAATDGVHLVDLQGKQPPRHLRCEAPYELAPVGTEIWAALGDQTLARIKPDATIKHIRALWGGRGRLRPTAIGAKGALWSEPQAAIIQDSGELARNPTDGDLVLPVSTTRWLTCRRDQVSLRDPGTQRWTTTVAGGRIIDGSILFEGRMAALILASDDALVQLVVLALNDGSLIHRLTLTGIDLVRFAPVRGYALLRAEDRKLLLFDLRFGQILAEHVEERAFADAAIDPSGQTFLLRFGDAHDDVHVGPVRALLAAPTPRLIEVEAPPPVDVTPLPPEPARTFHVGTETIAPTTLATTTEPQTARLEHYRTAISAFAGLAIARAWDDGRISPALDGALPFHTEVGGLLGAAQGRARAQVADAAERLEQALRAIDDERSPLATLAQRFELTPNARLVLLAIAAPSLWGEFARLYGILSNDEGRALVDELAVAQLLAPRIDRYAVADALDADAPLLRYGIVRSARDRQRPFTALSVDPLVLRMLRGVDCEAELVDVRIETSTVSLQDLLIPAQIKDDFARRLPAHRIAIRGRSGSGRHALLATVGPLGVIDATHLRGKRLLQLQAALQRCHLLGLLPCVDGLEAHEDRDELAQLLDEHPGPLAVRLPHDADPPLAPGYLLVDLPQLSMDQRLEVWHLLLAKHALIVRDPAELADRFRVGPGAITTACAETRVAAEADAALALETAIRQHLAAKLRATATRVDRLASWSKVVLASDIQESVLELIARIRRRRTVYDAWGMGEVITSARGVTALFSGGPGTGKTLVASAIAKELGMDLYRVDLSRIMSKWIGETEQNLAKLFDAAEDGHAIILFDEADSLFAKRTEVKSSVDRYANSEVNYLLQRLDTFEGIAILTTNFGTAIDSAFKRRLSFRLTFPFPDEDSREALWRAHLPPQLPRTGTFELAEVARKYQLSGGYIRNAALRAAFLAAEEQVPLSQLHLERAIRAEFREIGKIAESGVLE